ncbi:unnamed protein product [Chironomus riparius]|uniref:Uncharacterized protein n=1 Tax=Chironomus riparius TaxID=315576 RepID=A0A9N9WWL9_9DIPT|nr:unnamed protein product [Chironomus riparius]
MFDLVEGRNYLANKEVEKKLNSNNILIQQLHELLSINLNGTSSDSRHSLVTTHSESTEVASTTNRDDPTVSGRSIYN